MKIALRGAYILHKEGEKYIDCRDSFAINTNSYRFAISDGVSRSFFPGIWANLLVESYVNIDQNSIFEDTIKKCCKDWFDVVEAKVSMPNVKFYTRNAFRRRTPALATFVGLTISVDTKEWFVTVLGDSFLFYIEDNSKEMKCFSSKGEVVEFDNYPDYFSSLGGHKGTPINKKGELKNGIFILATDAIAKWIYYNRESAISEILKLECYEDFKNLIYDLRTENMLENDDTTIVILEISNLENESVVIDKFENYKNLEKLIEEEVTEISKNDKLLFDDNVEVNNKDNEDLQMSS
jgi:hypothetical protein